MTLKDLVKRFDFDSLLPYLEEDIKGDDYVLYAFRQAYDALRRMEPNPDYKGSVRIEYSNEDDEEEEGLNEKNEIDKNYICVQYLDGDSWENALAKELDCSPRIQEDACWEKVAVKCLWELTYYGFFPDEIQETYERMFRHPAPRNRYEVALDKLEESIWKHQNKRKHRHKLNGIRYTDFNPKEFLFGKKMNRPKRMREHRQKLRREYLGKMAFRENLIMYLSSPGSSFSRSDVEFLLTVDHGKRYKYRSVTEGLEGRLTYILESMTRYQRLDTNGFDNALVCVNVSSKYPLREAELAEFLSTLRTLIDIKDIRLGMILTDEDEMDVRVHLLLSKFNSE